LRPLVAEFGAGLVTELLREALDGLRLAIRGGELDEGRLAAAAAPAAISRRIALEARAVLMPRPRPVINATGVVVHTNLGRAPLSRAAVDHLAASAGGYLDLEYDLSTGERGSRQSHLAPLMARLFPGSGYTVVNNNASAILLCLRALGRGREVLISRGELVEIGGSFRVPDILEVSGAELREVGTTNRTRLADYERALGERTGAILKVHTSNFRVVGFTEDTSIEQLARLARSASVPLVVDWGSGDLVDLAPLGIHDERPVQAILDAGADIVTFSGDKLLGGPQSGFVVGRREVVDQVRRDPLARVSRLDRLQIAALHATLAAYVRGRPFEEIPALRMLALTPEAIEVRARAVARAIDAAIRGESLAEIVDGVSRTGGGSSPTGERPTRLLAVRCPSGDAGRLERPLRTGDPPIIARVQEGRLWLDLRTVLPEQDAVVAERLVAVLRGERTEPAARTANDPGTGNGRRRVRR
jgi:L-seryl-tRNA(Ser) seleniumtransferase